MQNLIPKGIEILTLRTCIVKSIQPALSFLWLKHIAYSYSTHLSSPYSLSVFLLWELHTVNGIKIYIYLIVPSFPWASILCLPSNAMICTTNQRRQKPKSSKWCSYVHGYAPYNHITQGRILPFSLKLTTTNSSLIRGRRLKKNSSTLELCLD